MPAKSDRDLHKSSLPLLLVLALSLFVQPLLAGQPPSPAGQPPRLIVVLVIDQFRADYLVKFHDRFGPDGFNRLLREGANFLSCYYPYAATETGPGHATLATGTTPNRNGIASNGWYDTALGRVVEAVDDPDAPIVGSPDKNPGASPHNLMTTTLADELRLATDGAAKVFGVAIKDRSAIFSTGHSASGAYWGDGQSGGFVTSSYYRDELPAWVVSFNQQYGAATYYGKEWKSGERVFLSLTSDSGKPDSKFFYRLVTSPYGNELVIRFAEELMRQETLGADDVTDFLFVGFSSNDIAGHRWGPYSDEMVDMTLQTDAQIAGLLAFLDQEVGAGNYWFVLSADHGVAPTLEQARARRAPAQNIDPDAVRQAVEQALAKEWGEDDWLVRTRDLIFNRETLRKHGVDLATAASVAGEAAAQVEGIRGYVAAGASGVDPAIAHAVELSTYPGRSPDVYLVQEPFALWNGNRGGTTHGTPYSYDTHVPLIFMGAAFRAGSYPEQVSTIDLAPTLAAALGINPPALSSGRVLPQALRGARRRGRATR